MAKHFRQSGGQPSAGGRDNRGPERQNPYLSTPQEDGQPAPSSRQSRPAAELPQTGEGSTPRRGAAPASSQESSEWPPLPSDFSIPRSFDDAPSGTRDAEVVRVRRRRHKRRWPKVVLAVVAAFVAVCVVCGALLVGQARGLQDDASSLMSQVDAFSKAATSGDPDAVKQAASSIAGSAQAMHRTTEGPLWAAAQFVPVLGTDVRQARELCASLDDLAANGVVPLGDALAGINLKDLVGSGGTVDIPTLQQLIQALGVMRQPLGDMASTLDSMEPFHIGRLNTLLDKARPMVDDANRLVGEAGNVLPAVPGMLGADGQTKTYLVLALNNVETNAGGGFPGAWGVMHVTDGRIELDDNFQAFAQRRDGDTGVDVTDEEISALNMGGAKISPAVTLATPQFPRAASMAAQAWLHWNGQAVDGVIAVDPVFLQSLLSVTGQSVDVEGVHVDGSNAATVLMHDTYWNFPVEAQDPFFASVASASFKAVLSGLGDVDMAKLGEAVIKGAETRDLQLWMADEAQEAAIEALGVSGKLSQDPVSPVLGVYTTDYTWSKIDWYLNMSTTVGDPVRNADGTTSYKVTTTVTNAMTPEEAETAPEYVTGGNTSLKRSRGDMVTGLFLFAPAGGSISDVQGTGGVFTATEGSVYGFDVWNCQLNDGPQETTTVTYTVTTSPQATQPLTVQRTPAARSFD